MGIIFQPRPPALGAHSSAHPPLPADIPPGHMAVFTEALELVVLGDTSRFDALFTDDVTFAAPHVRAWSLDALRRAVGQPEDSLRDIVITAHPREIDADQVAAEWRLTATFDRPALFEDNLLIEPTGGPVQMWGASFARFSGERIHSFRHYFDDSELLDEVPGVPAHARWSARRR